MTAVAEAPTKNETKVDEDAAGKRGRTADRDFTEVQSNYEELADFVNENEFFKKAGLDPVTPGQVKAIKLLGTDFLNTPERVAEREERKKQRDAEKAQLDGLTEEQKKTVQKAQRQANSATKAAERAAAAQAEADAIIAAAHANKSESNGESVAAKVEAAQSEADKPVAKPATGIKKPGAK